MTPLPVIEISGARFDDVEGFWEEVSRQLIPGVEWGRNLDALNDILRGSFGTPERGFVSRWTNSQRSRVALGYEETVRWLERKIVQCHPDNVPSVRSDLEAARAGRGQTLCDILVEMIRSHGVGGDEAEDCVELHLA
jgi:RNAse (barnase) inhibitor barstar